MCTMEFPKMSQYEKMAEVIPEFVESHINLNISSILGNLRHSELRGEELRKELEDLLALMKYRATIREKSMEINGINKEAEISEVNKEWLKPAELSIINNHHGTVEGLEAKLSAEITQSLEEMLQKENPELSEIPLDKLSVLTSILYSTARQKVDDKQIEEEFMYINTIDQKKEPFIKTYNIIGDDEMRTGVVFDIETDDGNVRGAMPTTPSMDANIKKATGAEDRETLSIEETDKAIQVIDSNVTPEERRGIIARIKEFARKFFDKINGRNEER